MSIIQFLFSDGNEITDFQNVTKFSTIEKQGETPKARLTMPLSSYEKLRLQKICTIKKDGEDFFVGRIENIFIENDEVQMELNTFEPDVFAQKTQDFEDALFSKFLKENPDLAGEDSKNQLTRLGKFRKISWLQNPKNPINLDEFIDKSSIKIAIDNKNIIKEVDLTISASWLKIVEGDLDLTTKIANRFKDGKINTMTPNLLEDSWPKFGTKLSNFLGSAKTKYAIGESRLFKAESHKLPEISISNDTPNLLLKKTFFDHKLSIFWEFEQFTTEKIESLIKAQDVAFGTKKTLVINLQNVQEYIENQLEHSFFTTALGKRILNKIYQSVQNFMLFSRRNMTISCELPLAVGMSDLGCGDVIELQGKTAQITELHYVFEAFDHKLKIVAKTFSQNPKTATECKIPEITRPKRKEFSENDVLYDINIKNDADAQYTKLRKFIHENKLNKSNYKQLLKTFFRENQTEINIITKPLKTKHCELNIIKTTDLVV